MRNKKHFLEQEYIPLLLNLNPFSKGKWGLMNAHQMVEHMMFSFRLANGKLKVDKLLSLEENIPKLQAWLLSNKLMKENIQNPLIPSIPPQPIYVNYNDSILHLEFEIKKMFEVYSKNSDLTILNPFYGYLTLELNVNLLFKHSIHHLRQFGIDLEYIED